MGVNLSIKDVPDAVAQRLRERAARNHRSLQGELMAIVEQAAADVRPPAVDAAARPGERSSIQGWKTIEQIAAGHRARHPQPLVDVPRAADLVRADRDAR